jgi:hypothetical protein
MKNKQLGIVVNSDFTLKEILLTIAKGAAIAVGLWLAYLLAP